MLSSLHHISLRGIRMPSRHSHAFAALTQGSWILDAGNWLVCGHVVPQRFLGSLQDQKFDSGFPMRFTLISCNQKIPKTSISKVLLYSISIYIYIYLYIYTHAIICKFTYIYIHIIRGSSTFSIFWAVVIPPSCVTLSAQLLGRSINMEPPRRCGVMILYVASVVLCVY
jgi:hypothetical protein